MDETVVSVVIPVYNGERYLAAALDSVFRQNYRPIEVMVVDDGSNDTSAEIAHSLAEVRYFYQANQGVAVARNVGIANASGDLIAFLDQDDMWATNKLRSQVDYLLTHPEVGYVLARQQTFLEPGADPPSWLKKELLITDSVAFLPGALLVRKEILHQVGGFEPRFRIDNDSEWFFRARDAGVPMAILPEILLYRRIHGSNQTSQTRSGGPLLRIVKESLDRRARGE